MTRINAGIDPSELPSRLLLAEYREITRIPNAIIAMRADLSLPIPLDFTLGKGHVRFFYDKIKFLHDRYIYLYRECQSRGYKVTFNDKSFVLIIKVYPELYKDYDVGPLDRQLIIDRIESKGFTLL